MITGNFIFFSSSYEDLVRIILSYYDKSEKAEEFKTKLLTPERFLVLKYFLLTITVIYGYILYVFRNKVYKLSASISKLSDELKLIVRGMAREIYMLTIFQKVLLSFIIISIFIFRVYFIFKFPFNIDEVFSYMFFVEKGFVVSATYYPGPNNHIFFSELCVFIDIFFNDPETVMRLPSLAAGMVVSFLFFIFLKRYFHFYAAIIATIIFSFSFNIAYYSIHGRGYILFILFVLVSAFSILKIIERRDVVNIYTVIYVFSVALGFYTIPVFLYPYVSLSLFAFIVLLSEKNWNKLKQFIIVNILIGLFVLAVYLPVFLLSGISSVTSNKWVEPLIFSVFWSSFLEYLLNIGNYLWDLDHYGWFISIVIILSACFILIKKGNKKLAMLMICIFILPVIILMLQRVQPFPRVWDYMILFISISIAVIINAVIYFLNEKVKLMLILLFFGGILFFSFKSFYSYSTRDFYYQQLNAFIDRMSLENPRNVYVAEDTYNIFLRYRYLNTRNSINIAVVSDAGSQYDFIILPKGASFPEKINRNDYVNYGSNSYIQSYKLKGDK